MILFKLCYGDKKSNLSVNEYFTIGDLVEASLIKFNLADEDIDFIYFLYENHVIILGSDELRFNDNIDDLLTKYNITEYTLYLKKYSIADESKISLEKKINKTMSRIITKKFKTYIQERNDKLFAERLQNEEKNINNQNTSQTPPNTMRNNVRVTYPRTVTITRTPGHNRFNFDETYDSDDYDDEDYDYRNYNTPNMGEDSLTTSDFDSSIDDDENKTSSNTNYQNFLQQSNIINRLNNVTPSNNRVSSNRTSVNNWITSSDILSSRNILHQERKNTIDRIRRIERKYGINMTSYLTQTPSQILNENNGILQNNDISTGSGILNLINRTIGLLNIHDIINEYRDSVNQNINMITENMNIINENNEIGEQNAQNIISFEDVKVVMSVNEFNNLENKNYIDIIREKRPDDVIQKNTNIEISSESNNNSDIKIEYDIKDRDLCSICTDVFENDSTITILPSCIHLFHKDCIMRWVTECKNKCPLCNKEITETPIYC